MKLMEKNKYQIMNNLIHSANGKTKREGRMLHKNKISIGFIDRSKLIDPWVVVSPTSKQVFTFCGESTSVNDVDYDLLLYK